MPTPLPPPLLPHPASVPLRESFLRKHLYTVRIWDADSGTCLTTFLVNAPVLSLVSFPPRPRLAVALTNGEVLVLDLVLPAAPPRTRKRRPGRRRG